MNNKRTISDSFYLNGNKRYEFPELNGAYYGLAKSWHPNGSVGFYSTYRNDFLNGSMVIFAY